MSDAQGVPSARLPAELGAPLHLPQEVVGDLPAALALARAERPEDVAQAVLAPLVTLPAVRAAAVVAGAGSAAVVVASSGYGCGGFAPGASLPLDSGLPITEAVRTGRVVLQGRGPSWVAVPLPANGRTTGALLLSLTGPLPDDAALAGLRRIASALGPALARAQRSERAAARLTALEHGLAGGSCPTPPGVELSITSRTLNGPLGGDVVACVLDGDDAWLLVADVSGRGACAAPAAHALRAALHAAAPGCAGPGELLLRLDRAVTATEVGSSGEGFVTALVLRLRGDEVALASAGHPPPLRLDRSGVQPVPVVPGLPLGSGLGAAGGPASTLQLGDDTLVAWTDGLTDRDGEVDLRPLLAGLDDLAPAVVADRLLSACDAFGEPQDDLSLLVLRRAVGRREDRAGA